MNFDVDLDTKVVFYGTSCFAALESARNKRSQYGDKRMLHQFINDTLIFLFYIATGLIFDSKVLLSKSF